MLSVGFSRFEEEIMFENPKYITRGVQGEIPDSLMLLMWQMIAAMQTSQKDYLHLHLPLSDLIQPEVPVLFP